ncbi:hypothetical protein CS022_02165 [Veronia nyctiphanis]|uniref:Uncharacterized protein n=1 Tax=Veronia nyctiphanis TaxID=1278244 RepID=A0A4Q0YUH3_9GAMM|nr:type II secretion system protein [Veronia nyctiphanis]RXJ74433.1 hypothetical protein CS022_02165 [Veronia nyctiphanis]
MKKMSGFTLIELVVTLVMLGTLSVTAAPKLLPLSGEAYKAQLMRLKGSMGDAALMAHAHAILAGETNTPTVRLSMPGVNADVHLRFGYPAANYQGIGQLIDGLDHGGDWTSMGDRGSTPHTYYVTFRSKIPWVKSSLSISEITNSGCYMTYTDVNQKSGSPALNVFSDGC